MYPATATAKHCLDFTILVTNKILKNMFGLGFFSACNSKTYHIKLQLRFVK